ncbi:MAG: aldehyde dehydrogenase family protein [Vicinamibacterales bacterium]
MRTGSYVNGTWYHPSSSRLTRNVPTRRHVGRDPEFPLATTDDVRRAIDAATAAWRGWKKTPGPERGRVLWRAADIARRRVDEIAETLTREEGKVLKEARGEVMKGISLLEYYAGEGFRMHGKTMPSEARDTFAYTLRQPLGVVGLIAPWNFPWAIPVWKSAPALVAGNCVVFKPAELVPATASLMTEIYEEAGLPPGVFNMVVGSGRDVGEAMVHARRAAGHLVHGLQQRRRRSLREGGEAGAKVTCEMGGKNAVIVMPDADLDKAAVAIHGGAFGSTGQRCTATSRVIAHPDVKPALLDRLVALAESVKVGPGLDTAMDMGPAVDEKQWSTVMAYIEAGKQDGARLVTGGARPAHLAQGYFIQPTIFDGVRPDMRIFKEEIFGPVLSVALASTLEDALHQANAVEYGLTTSIFTQDVNTVMRFVEDVEVGMVHVNEPTVGGEAQLPFGGTKATGVGEREMAEEGLHFFTELKTVFVNYGGNAERSLTR